MSGRLTNWAGNVTFQARQFHRPASVPELRRLVAGAGVGAGVGRLRPVGTAHSFSRIADTTGDLVSVAGLPDEMEIDERRRSVTVSAGTRYGELAARLHPAGFGLPGLASLPHISVAGAVATATHGSGDRVGNLATAVSALELVTADGDLVRLSRETDGERFAGAVVGLGALGVVTRLTLDLMPTFEVRQYVYEDLPRESLDAHWREIFASAYSVSLFTDWAGPRVNQVWLKQRGDEPEPPPRRWGARRADGPRHPVPGMPAGHCTDQLGVPGPWHLRLPHFRLDFTPSSGQELQSEYLLPRDRLVAALAALDRIAHVVAPVLRISEIRTVAADDLWLSPSYRRDSVAVHFTWVSDPKTVNPVIAAVEEQLAPLSARPHWGKLFGTGPATVRELYPRLPDFVDLMRDLDPAGRFRNPLLDRYLPA